ncbi:MAG: aminotransferase class I/II-fold pyridoxal phosphate-dependent enzyme [Thermoanaerobaculia bacterium]|nr:aminotransferase class I/II-fold pyridoxal phosphate-dependent enzyme [Thermoanaerobaculia bacterium]
MTAKDTLFDRASNPLELSPEAMRQLVDAAMARLVPLLESLPRQPAADTEGGVEVARSLIESAPESGRPLDEILDLLFDKAVPKSFNTAGPGYLAYIPGGGLFQSAVADLMASSFNRFTGVFAAAPALAQLEANVVRWFADIVGYPPESRGILTPGGSIANWIGLVTARRERLGEAFHDGVVYTSDQSHHSVLKSAILTGFAESRVRRLPSDSSQRLDLAALERAIRADRAAGLRPAVVNANAGTTNTGAIDPLPELADLATAEGLWLHVDAAYGGFFAMTERGRDALRGLERADSLVLDPHKALFLPYGTGALLVRDGEALRRTHGLRADYMPPIQDDPDLIDFCEISPELSRPFRGLRVWLPIQMHGLDAFRRNLDEKLDLAHWAADELERIESVRLVARPRLSLLAFRIEPPGLEGEPLEAFNRAVLDGVNQRGQVYLTGTVLDGRFVLRICVLSFRTHRDRVDTALDQIRDEIEQRLSA